MGMVKNLRTNLRTNGFYPKCVIPQTVGITRMAGVAQMVERWIVIPVVEGSNPFARPRQSCPNSAENINFFHTFAHRGRSSTG